MKIKKLIKKIKPESKSEKKKSFWSSLNPKSYSDLKRVWLTYVLPQWKLLVVSMTFMVAFGALEALSVKMLEPVFNEVFIDKNKEVLYIVALQILGLFAAKGIAYYIQSVSMVRIGTNFTQRLQVDLYDKLIVQDMEFFHRNNSGSLITYFIQDINMIRDAVLNSVTTLVKDTCSVVFLIVLMFVKSFEMAVVMFVLFPIGFYPIIYFGKKIKKIFSSQQLSFSSLYSSLTQSFQGIKIVKSYNMEKSETKKIADNAKAIADIQVKMAKTNNILSPLMEFLGGFAAAATLCYGGYKIVNGTLTTGAFMVFLLAIIAAYKPMKSIASLNMRVQMGVKAIERVFTIMNAEPVIYDKADAKELEVSKGRILIDNIKFDYAPGHEVLHGISMEIKEGETVAIVGAAGSGKSTIINLLLRFYDVKEGRVLIDGQDVRDVRLKSLRNKIAFVSQDVVLFDDTIEKNILMGNPDASAQDAIEAAKNAAADNFITHQKNGYNTVVGERGGNLSGGQKQMISIARAMLKNAPILLLDEATSSLDTKSERMVQEGLEKLMKGRTSIVIAHRLSTIVNADRIYVFDSGNIVESGTHKELLVQNGYYSTLYNMQFKN
ncbi:MAG: ATP-binding cassette domain-containing protein [Endomicrobium sp.]|jgi:subfamily B ATP-binding cassette protein MsbA|nr:ATP-binding cassette domain-containing protein [Endomicrobium sp.]